MKCLLIDDHALFRDGVQLLVSLEFPDIHMLQAGTLDEAMQILAVTPLVDLVLLDLTLPDAKGLHALNAMRKLYEDVTCVVLSADESPATALSAIDMGASGFIPKTAESSDMLHAIRTVLAGGVYLPSNLTIQPANRSSEATGISQGLAWGLSSRQMEVLRMLIEGKSNKQISTLLDLSESTVKTHIEAVFRRLDVKSRTQAVVVAARLGLLLPVRNTN